MYIEQIRTSNFKQITDKVIKLKEHNTLITDTRNTFHVQEAIEFVLCPNMYNTTSAKQIYMPERNFGFALKTSVEITFVGTRIVHFRNLKNLVLKRILTDDNNEFMLTKRKAAKESYQMVLKFNAISFTDNFGVLSHVMLNDIFAMSSEDLLAETNNYLRNTLTLCTRPSRIGDKRKKGKKAEIDPKVVSYQLDDKLSKLTKLCTIDTSKNDKDINILKHVLLSREAKFIEEACESESSKFSNITSRMQKLLIKEDPVFEYYDALQSLTSPLVRIPIYRLGQQHGITTKNALTKNIEEINWEKVRLEKLAELQNIYQIPSTPILDGSQVNIGESIQNFAKLFDEHMESLSSYTEHSTRCDYLIGNKHRRNTLGSEKNLELFYLEEIKLLKEQDAALKETENTACEILPKYEELINRGKIENENYLKENAEEFEKLTKLLTELHEHNMQYKQTLIEQPEAHLDAHDTLNMRATFMELTNKLCADVITQNELQAVISIPEILTSLVKKGKIIDKKVYHGLIIDLFKYPTNLKMPVLALAKDKLFNMVVTSKEIAEIFLEEIENSNIPGLFKFIPLDISAERRRSHSDQVLYNTITFEHRFRNVFFHIFGNTHLCDDTVNMSQLSQETGWNCVNHNGTVIFNINGLLVESYCNARQLQMAPFLALNIAYIKQLTEKYKDSESPLIKSIKHKKRNHKEAISKCNEKIRIIMEGLAKEHWFNSSEQEVHLRTVLQGQIQLKNTKLQRLNIQKTIKSLEDDLKKDIAERSSSQKKELSKISTFLEKSLEKIKYTDEEIISAFKGLNDSICKDFEKNTLSERQIKYKREIILINLYKDQLKKDYQFYKIEIQKLKELEERYSINIQRDLTKRTESIDLLKECLRQKERLTKIRTSLNVLNSERHQIDKKLSLYGERLENLRTLMTDLNVDYILEEIVDYNNTSKLEIALIELLELQKLSRGVLVEIKTRNEPLFAEVEYLNKLIDQIEECEKLEHSNYNTINRMSIIRHNFKALFKLLNKDGEVEMYIVSDDPDVVNKNVASNWLIMVKFNETADLISMDRLDPSERKEVVFSLLMAILYSFEEHFILFSKIEESFHNDEKANRIMRMLYKLKSSQKTQIVVVSDLEYQTMHFKEKLIVPSGSFD